MNIQLNKYRINIHDSMSFTIKVNTSIPGAPELLYFTVLLVTF